MSSSEEDRHLPFRRSRVGGNGTPGLRTRGKYRHFAILITLIFALISAGLGCRGGGTIIAPAFDGTLNAEIRIPGGAAVGNDVVSPGHEISRVKLGESVLGDPIVMEVFGDGANRILIVGGIHGDEPGGVRVAELLIESLRSKPEYWRGRTVGVLACANPDGLRARTRVNAAGIDLNRNFPTRDWRPARAGEHSHGSAAGSEPETRAVMRAVELVRPQRLIDLHSIANGGQCNNYDGPGRELAELMGFHNGYPVSEDIGYPTPGALGCWVGIDLNIPAITLELPRGESGRKCWEENARALFAATQADEINPPRWTALGIERE